VKSASKRTLFETLLLLSWVPKLHELKLMKKITLIFCVILISAMPVIACDCFEILSHREEFRKSKAVFIGEVVKIEISLPKVREKIPEWVRNELGDRITFRVIKSWKGSKTKKEVWSDIMHLFCAGWDFKVGEKYLVYARRNNDLLMGAEYCFRTRPLETTNKRELKEFKELDNF
jgi:hypothetical protein